MSFAPGWRGTNTIAQENEQMMGGYTTPRRNRLDLIHPAELAIVEAVSAVEKLGCSIGLTNAINKLQEAKDLVSDFIDGKEG